MPQMPMNKTYSEQQNQFFKKFSGALSDVAKSGGVNVSNQRRVPVNAETPQQPMSSNYSDKKKVDLSKLGTLTTKFGGSTKYEGNHPGIDIANKMGTPIPSLSSGVVTKVESGKKQGDKGFGNSIIVTDKNGNKFRYSHLLNEFVKVGDKVNVGSQLGTMGNTGSTYSLSGGDGTHLDLRIFNAYGQYVNPEKFL